MKFKKLLIACTVALSLTAFAGAIASADYTTTNPPMMPLVEDPLGWE